MTARPHGSGPQAGHTEESPLLKAARELLGERARHRTEGNVQSSVDALLRATEPGSLESQYQTSDGVADIYLPNRRVFVETKAYPKANNPDATQAGRGESATDQLARYVRAEINRELGMLPIDDAYASPWRGIVTDGTNWHAWEFPHQRNATARRLESARFLDAADGAALVEWLEQVIGARTLGMEWIPAQPGPLFTELKSEHDELHGQVPARAKPALATKRGLWLDMMRASGMVPTDPAGRRRLFLAHSFLIAVVRLVSHALSGDPDDEWETALRDGFASWTLDFARGRKWADQLRQTVARYDWRRRRSDVLRELYQHYVSAADRKVFGEFYTPDWLAALMVEAVCDEAWIETSASAAADSRQAGIGLLDPACGSGTFLYHAALRIVDAEVLSSERPAKKAEIAARLLNGIDIHPVAVEIARVNIVRALPQMPPEGDSALNVYLGDSLQVHRRDDLFSNPNEMRLTSPKGGSVSLPLTFVRSPSFHEHMRQMVNAASAHASLPPALVRLPEGPQLVGVARAANSHDPHRGKLGVDLVRREHRRAAAARRTQGGPPRIKSAMGEAVRHSGRTAQARHGGLREGPSPLAEWRHTGTASGHSAVFRAPGARALRRQPGRGCRRVAREGVRFASRALGAVPSSAQGTVAIRRPNRPSTVRRWRRN